MAGVWKRDGTVTVTSGSKRVIGVGTTFADPKNGVAKGHIFTQISGSAVDLYEVDYVVSNTELYLVQAFRGTTASGAAYAIITTFYDSIPEFSRKLTATLASYQEQSDVLQLLYTSDAAEITVTAPDGTTRNLIPWKRVTSEGEGQAARAKVEADRAKTEADNAAQVVIDSAVPFPDVWIPFNDSLRMLAGYGREVKVGSDVVARMVNFERSTTATYIDKSGVLRTAAINEPRFEKEGLLIEGQSTNLIARSEGTTFQTANASFQTLTNNVSGVLPVVGQRILFAANNNETNAGLIQASMTLDGGSSYTYSLFIKVEDGDDSDLANCLVAYSASGASITNRAVIQDFGNGVKRLSGNISVGGTGSQTVYIRVQRRGAWATTTWAAVVGGVQVESLPFASSYIPTNGTAVTRAADKCWIQAELNNGLNGDGNIKTVAVTSDILGARSDYNFIVNTPWGAIDYTKSAERVSSQDVSLNLRSPIVASEISVKVAVFNGRNGSGYLNGGKTGSKSGSWMSLADDKIQIGHYNNGVNFHFGHIRDLKIWHRALSDTQIRGLK